jgi:Bacterial PH domain
VSDEPIEGVAVVARPQLMTRVAYVSAAVVLVVFVITALVMKQANAGASFTDKDQLGTVVVGVVLAGLLLMPSRPRLRADADGIRLRAFLGGWRVVPWDLVVRVDFPSNVRFARIVLPADETLAVYAVQRMDRDYAVAAMQGLRRLYAQTHPVAG